HSLDTIRSKIVPLPRVTISMSTAPPARRPPPPPPTAAALADHGREPAARLDEISDTDARVVAMQEGVTQTEARIAEREQLIEMKVRELKGADEERAKSAGELARQIATIAEREKKLTKAEATATGKLEEHELNELEHELRARAERIEQKAVLREDVDRLEQEVSSTADELRLREQQLATRERELEQARMKMAAQQQALVQRESELATMRPA